MRIGFVVLTYNRSDAILALLRALAPQLSGQDRLVIADDGSRAEHVEALAAGFPACPAPAWHVWHPDTGFTASKARNLGARVAQEAGADYLVFLDGDCIPGPGFVRAHRALARPGAFVNGSRVLLSPALTDRVLAGTVDPMALSAGDWLRLRLAGDVNKLGHLVHFPGLPGRTQASFSWKGIRSCNFGLGWSDFAAVDGFDETFAGWGHEDADLVLRLHNRGLVRKNGHWATEVLHLWHPENARDRESANRLRVETRMRDGTIRAAIGLARPDLMAGAKITALPARGE